MFNELCYMVIAIMVISGKATLLLVKSDMLIGQEKGPRLPESRSGTFYRLGLMWSGAGKSLGLIPPCLPYL